MNTFRLWPERGSALFVRVFVWPTKKAFLAHMNANHITRHGNPFGGRTQGACSRYEAYRYANGARRKSACVAEVNLWAGKLTMNIVTHELFHATIAWGNRVGFDFAALESRLGVTATEERITYVHGRLCSQFVGRALSAGLYEDSLAIRKAA